MSANLESHDERRAHTLTVKVPEIMFLPIRLNILQVIEVIL